VADDAKPGKKPNVRSSNVEPVKAIEFNPAALSLKEAAKNGTPFCERCAEAAAARGE
jgi:type VI secretion system secreted protein VgrG